MLDEQLKKAVEEYNQGRYSEALTTLLTSDYTEEDYIVFYYIGLIYIKLEDYESGRENLVHYIDSDNNLLRVFQCRMLLAYVSIEIEDYVTAQNHLDALLDAGYESAKLYSLIGYIFYKKDMPVKSVKYYRKALTIDPENSNALNSLGYILSDDRDNLQEAETLCRRALSMNAENAAYLDSLGWVCLKNNKLPASLSFLNRAHQLDPANKIIEEHLNQLKYKGITN